MWGSDYVRVEGVRYLHDLEETNHVRDWDEVRMEDRLGSVDGTGRTEWVFGSSVGHLVSQMYSLFWRRIGRMKGWA